MSTPSPALPPCIVLGLETQIGLSVVRELGRAGIRVIGVAHDVRAIGLASRHLWQGRVVNPPRSEELLGVIRALGEEHGPCALLAISETNLSWLVANRGRLGNVRPALPPAEALQAVLDKQRTLQAAVEVGIDVPRTAEPASLREALSLGSSFGFPAVLKWKDPQRVSARLRDLGLPLLKAEYVNSAQDWPRVAERYAPLGEWPLVQTYARGRGLGQFFFMQDGVAVRRFQHLRIAEWPPEGGFSSVCDAVPLDQHLELQRKSEALLRKIGWTGVAMVEYRWDAETDRALLMEINGRFWGSFPLAAHSGAGFALLAYYAAMGLPLPTLPPPRQDLRCRMVATELKRLHRLLLSPKLVADPSFVVRPMRELMAFIGNFVRPRVRYYVWASDDPKPFFADLRNVFAKSFAAEAR
jgi:predicted ATP-grasp superfamily ATP-dependent carboligase